MSDFIAHVIAELDMSKAESKMSAFTSKKHTVDVDVNLVSKNGNINNYLNQIKSQFGQAGNSAGTNFANSVNSSLGKINVKNAASQIANLQRTLKSMNFSSSSIDTITRDLQEMELAVTKVTTRMNGQNLNVRVDGIDQMGRAVSVVKEFDSVTGRMQRTSETVATSLKQMFTSADASKLNADITALDANFVKLKGSVNNESTALAKLKTDLANIGNISGLDRQQAEFERITQEVNRLSVAYKEAYAENQALVSSQQLMSKKTILGNQIQTWMNNNTKAAKIYRTELEQIQRDLANVGNASQLKAVSSAFNELKTTATAAGNAGKTTLGMLVSNMTKLSPLFGMGAMITTSIRAVKSMIDSVIALDTALIDLQKTTTMTNSELESFYTGANDIAKQMGVSTEEIISQAAAWSRLGYSSAEAAQSMAKLSSQFASISPGMDVDTATDGLVSIMKAYDVDVNDVLDGIMSKVNIIGNTAATSNADIVEMLTRSSSAMAEANNTLDQTIALETAAVEITQDAASVGTAYKTLSMRIRGYDEETESFTNDVEVLSGEIADLTKTAKTPGGISLFTDESKSEYKSTYQLLKEISEIYDDLTDKEQAQLLEKLAGKRQGQVIAATIKNFGAAEKAMESMANSAGSADREMSIIMDSLEYKLNALKETGVGIAQNLFQRDDMKAVVDVLTGFLGIIDKVTEKLGLFGTIGLGTGITVLVKKFSLLKEISSSIVSEAMFSLKGLTATINAGTGLLNPASLQSYTAAIDGLSLAQAKVALSTTNLSAAQKEQILVNAGLMASESSITAVLATEAMEKAGLSTETAALIASKAGLTSATATCTAAEFEAILATEGIVGADAQAIMANMGLTTSNTTAAFSFTALAAAAKTALASIGAFFLTNPVGWAIMAVAAIAGTIKLVDALTESFDEAVEKAEESRSAYQGTQEELQSLQNELDTTKAKIDELQGKDTLTIVEEGELAKLQQQNDMLEAQIAIKERLAQTQAKTAAEDANHVLTKETTEATGVDEYGNVTYTTSNIIEKTTAQQEKLNSTREEYNRILQDYKTLSEKHSKDTEDHGGWFETTQWEKDEKQLKSYEQQLENYENQMTNLDSEISNNLSTISENFGMLYDENGNLIAGYEDTANAVNDLYNFTLYADSATQDMAEDTAEASNAVADYSERITELSSKLEEFKTMQSNIQSAMKDSTSATGLTAEEINNLEAAYGKLSGYDPSKLFEETANGVHLNSEELARLNEQLETKTLEEYAQTIKDIQASIYRERAKGNDTSALEQELQQAKLLKSEYEGLTSAYNKWLTAKSGGNERDSYESVGKGYEDMQKILNEGWYGDDSLNAYLDLLLSAEQRTGDAVTDFEKLNKTIEGTSHSLLDYWKFDKDNNLVTDGLYDFLDDVNAKLGDSFAKVNEDGLYEFDFDGDKLKQVADAFGTSTEMVELFERAMIDAGMAVDMSDKSIVDQINDLRDSLKGLQEDGKLSDGINLDFDVDKDPIEDVRSTIEDLKSERVKIDAETNPEAAKELDELIAKCEQQYYFRLNAETDGSLDRAVSIVEQLKSLTAAPLSVEARVANEGQIQELAGQLAALPEEVQIAVGISAENVGNVNAIVNQLNTQPSSIQVPVNYEKGSDPESVDDAKGIANYELGESPTTVPDASGKANFSLGRYPTSLPSIHQNIIANRIGFAEGTAHADGTVHAYARAKDWALSHDENALVNELGTESIVRDGKWIPIPGNAHFEALKKGDIIFSAEQTKELIRTGKVTSGGGRGKIALADGTVWASAYESGSGGSRRKNPSATTTLSSKTTASKNSSYKSPTKSSGSSKSNSKSDDDFEEKFDLIEIAVKRIGEAIDRLKVKAESVFKSLSKRNSAAADEISMITEEINLQNSAYTRYMQQANSVGLSSDWAEKIKNGSIDISTVTDEDLADKIKEFQDFYDKAIECKDAVAELHEEIAQLYADRFNNIQSDFEHQLSLVEHLTNTYNTGLDTLEAKGLMGSKVYYQALQKAEKENQEILTQELVDLTESFNQAMASGEIEKNSEQWYEMQESINSVKEALDESNLSLLEFEKTMRELDWEYFDFMEERISAITDEADFLVDLMANGKLFDDKGYMTDTGMATMGLHGQNYNVYMAQADQYANEIKSLNNEIANDPYNTDLIERRQELLELQREAILAAEDEKQAISDLVEDGINAQLDALKELIDTYTDSLDSAKDLYDYQKKVKDQTSEIASLQKQLSAYSGDTSEETRATIQKIEVDLSKAMEELQETEYDQYISDQKKMLDDLYTEYETILNQRLDDVDALISDMIDTINANSSTIGDTIMQECANVGYTLTDSMNAIWTNEGGAYAVISKYGEQFLSQNTSTLNAILGIKAYTDSLIAKADAEAKAKEEATKKQTEASKPATQPTNSTTSSTSSKTTTPTRTDKDNYGVALAIWNGNYGWGTGNTRVSRLKAKGFDPNKVQSIVNQMGKDGYVYSGAWVGKYYGIRDLAPYHYNKYAKGLKRATKDENAWVNELDDESIISPTKRAIITHVSKGSSILNGDATENIWDMANDPSGFISKNLFPDAITNDIEPYINVDNSKIDNVTFTLPNVYNYEDFMNRAKKDDKFEGMIQAMTVRRLNGGTKHGKNKYVW